MPGRTALAVLFSIVVFAVALWSIAALWVDGSSVAAVGFGVSALAVSIWVRPWRRWLLVIAAASILVIVWWRSLEPSNDRDWQPDVARTAAVSFDGDRFTVSNVRNFFYRSETDYDENWEERTYDLANLRGADLFLSYWGSPWIAHTIISWEFEGSEPLVISIETRKEKGEEYSALLGFFRQFELYYVVSDERDVVRLRTNQRGEDVYLYRLQIPLETARAVLLDYLKEIDRLANDPEWYNAATHNCTTGIRLHVQHVSAGRPWDWRILVNGQIDQLLYERGTVDTLLPFEELRERSAVSKRGLAAGNADDYSIRIREGLPGARAATSHQHRTGVGR